MELQGKTVTAGSRLFDKFKGLGIVISLTETTMEIEFPSGEKAIYQAGGYLGGLQRLGWNTRMYVEVPEDKVNLVSGVLAALGVTLNQGQ